MRPTATRFAGGRAHRRRTDVRLRDAAPVRVVEGRARRLERIAHRGRGGLGRDEGARERRRDPAQEVRAARGVLDEEQRDDHEVQDEVAVPPQDVADRGGRGRVEGDVRRLRDECLSSQVRDDAGDGIARDGLRELADGLRDGVVDRRAFGTRVRVRVR